MNIYPASQNNFSKAISLLKKNNLPTEDISDATKLFVLENDNEIAGTIAIEYLGTEALLRSLTVAAEKRGNRLGIKLVSYVERFAKKHGVQNIFLLTTTATNFFFKRGYETTDRNNVSAFIKNTSEYCSVCPSSATVMKKQLL